jgi:glycine/D-amino acid oxidase-like deaminating enzyme
MGRGEAVTQPEFGVWQQTALPSPALPALDGAVETDIAIVGAGYTGLSTALHLAEQGLDCTLIEAREPGWGESGRNTGWLEPNWWMKSPEDVAKRFGPDLAAALMRWVGAGPTLLQGWIDRYRFDIGWEQRGLLMVTDSTTKAQALKSEADAWHRAGVANEFVDAAHIPGYLPTDRYQGGLLLREGGTLNPLALSRELARACVAAGARCYARSPVHRIQRIGSQWRLECDQGSVHCRSLVLASGIHTRRLWPAIDRCQATWHAAVIASSPYPALDSLLPAGVPVADLDLSNVFTLRTTPEGRLVTSVLAPLRTGLTPSRVGAPFMRKFRRLLPGLPEPHWEWRHFGEIGLSRDMMPRLCQVGERAWTAFGYSGTGINYALLMGRELAARIAPDAFDSPRFPASAVQPWRGRQAVSLGLRYLVSPLSRALASRS